MGFEEIKLDKRLIEVLDANNIKEPTEIQRLTYPLAANGHDVVGVSKTGSGKTLAFVLPILAQVIVTDKPFYTLIITPTRELALQISRCIALFDSLGVRHATLVGGEPLTPQVNQLNKYPHIVLGTPGRIAKHIIKTKNFKINSIRKLVLDEADRFFDQDFTEDLAAIADRLKRKNQTLMFTATLTDKTEQLSSLFMKRPRVVGDHEKYEAISTLEDHHVLVPEKYKLAALYNYLKGVGQMSTIVFIGMCREAEKIAKVFGRLGLRVDCLHGNMPQAARELVLKKFRDEEFSILFATDLAARGLDIPHVEAVVNYDLPNTAKDYVHRIGRTARAGKAGQALSFVTQYDVLDLQKLEYVLKRKLPAKKLTCYNSMEEITELYEAVNAELNEKRVRRKK